MSITDTMQSQIAMPTKSTTKQPQPRRNRIRRGQKLDEVVSLAEQRQFASESKYDPSCTSESSSSAAGPSSNTSTSTIAAGGESPFQLQEYLSMLVRRDPHNVEAITSLPTEADIESLAFPHPSSTASSNSSDEVSFQSVDTDVWVYEQLRRLVLDLTTPWLTSLQIECDRFLRPSTCAAMNAGDWMYLCASHGEEKQCCAIDYMVHTLDGATSLLNSARHFPSRTYVPNTSLRHFGSIARRLSRIFVHAWCYHKDTFLACEAESSLYSRFLVLVEKYDLTATDYLPPRPGHGPIFLSSSNDGGAIARDLDEANEFSRGPTPAFALNGGTTAKRERSSTAAPRTFLTQGLAQSQSSHAVDAVGLVPPPAPSPAIASRPEHQEGDEEDAPPAWGSRLAQSGSGSSIEADEKFKDDDDDDVDEDEDEDEDSGGNDGGADVDHKTQKFAARREPGDDDDATISLRGSEIPKGLSDLVNGLKNVDIEDDGAGKEVSSGQDDADEFGRADKASDGLSS